MGSGPSKPQKNNPIKTIEAATKFLASKRNPRKKKITKQLSTLCLATPRNLSDVKRSIALESTPEVVELAKADSEGILHILNGNPNFGYESKPKIVRIFTSSTFTDTYQERNQLMVDVYPKLKDFCREFGYEFQVVDMRWGVREQSENDHLAVELCLQELKACQKLSTGPNFVSFLSHKYGYRPFPRVIPAEEFDLLCDEVTEEEEILLESWFLLDDNIVPPAYILQPISTHYPDFLSDDAAARKRAKSAWWKVFCKLQNVLVRGAKENLKDSQKIHNYVMSVTERELESGILNSADPGKHCVWFKRTFVDIEKAPKTRQISRYTEIEACDSLSLDEIKSSFQNLRDKEMPSKLPESKIYNYPIHWDKDEGINPQIPEHSQYLKSLCQDFLSSTKQMIQTGVEEAKKDDCLDPVMAEVVQHSAFRHQCCKLFSGRDAVLQDIKDYIHGSSESPFVIVGGSGCGKTAILAMSITQSWQWLNGTGVIVYRFLGTTKESSSIKPLLRTLNKQLSLVFSITNIAKKYYKSEEMKILVQGFTQLLRKASKNKPLVLVLDSLDHLDASDGGRQLEWLPRQLPHHVKIILSMRPDEKYGVFPRCKTIFTDEQCYCIVPNLVLAEVQDFIQTFLKVKNRILTPLQNQVLLAGFEKSSSPLYLKLALDESMRWHSYDSAQVSCLYSSISAMVNAFFKRLEQQHGQTLVSFALAFFTAAQNGLTEPEMEDLLSLNDPVLNDVYQYWIPPVRRLPPLLWVRIKNDLESYLSKRSVMGVQIYMWSFRQFAVTCQERYLANQTSRTVCHTLLAEYFMGIWADVPKPYRDKNGEVKEARRYVARQPPRFDNKEYNLRKINELPYHLVEANKLDFFKKEVICNYEFLLAKISAVGVSALLHDLKAAQMAYPKDEDIAIVLEALQLSRHVIQRHPAELSGQLIGRLHINVAANERALFRAKDMIEAKQLDKSSVAMVATLVEMLEKLILYQNLKYQNILQLLSQAHNSSEAVLVPHTACLIKPGGQLLHNLCAHHETVNTLNITSKGTILITGADDNTVKTWDVSSGELLMSCEVDGDILYVSLYPDDTKLVASTIQGTIYVIDVNLGISIQKRHNVGTNDQNNLPVTVCQPLKGPPVVVVVTDNKLLILHHSTLSYITACENEFKVEKREAGRLMLIQTCKGYVVFAKRFSNSLCVLSVKDNKTSTANQYEVFEKLNKTSRHREIISAICLIADQKQAIVCSGQTNDVHIISLDNGKITTKIHAYSRERILDIFYQPKNCLDYFTKNDYVGTCCRKTGEWKAQFPHPCKVRRVLAGCGNHVITLGEDNIVRIWDKTMHPFSPDVSEFSGKVTVQTKSSMNNFRSILDTFADQFDQDAMDTKSMLTTEDVKNYWTKDMEHAPFVGDVTTRFFTMPNKRYLLVTQDGTDQDTASIMFTQCVTIWDLVQLQCVRRFFPPWQTLYIQEVISMDKLLFTDVGKDDSPLYIMNITNETFKPEMIYNGPESIKTGAPVAIHVDMKGVVAESSTGSLCLYDLDKGEVIATLKAKTEPALFKGYNFTNLKVIGEYVLAVHSHRYLCSWHIPSGSLRWQVDLTQHVIAQSDTDSALITIHSTRDDKFLVAVTEMQKTDGHGKLPKSLAVFEFESGNFKSNLNRVATKEYDHSLALLRLGKEKLLQLVALDKAGSAYLLDELTVGRHSNRHLVSEDCSQCVTWCTEAKEDHLVLWSIETDKLKGLGGFTLDEQLNCVHLASVGSGIIVSTAIGLVRLQMSGSEVSVPAASTAPESEQLEFFQHPELDVKMEIEAA